MAPPSRVAPTHLVTTYSAPKTFIHRLVAGLVLFYFASYAAKSHTTPGSAPYEVLQKFWPLGAEQYLWLQEKIFVPVVAIHAVETAVMAWRLARAGVRTGSLLWWKWILSCAIEGLGSHERLGALINAEK